MTVQPFRANIGVKRITSSLGQTTSSFTQSVRASIQEVVNNYNGWVNYMDGVAGEVLLEALQPTFDLSQVYVPIETGALKDSGYLELRQIRGSAQVEIGYGKGGEPDYAVIVHENTEVHHEAPTKAKYLQSALEEDGENVQQRIRDGFKIASGT